MATRRAGAALVVGVLGVALLLRAPITSVPPVLATIAADLGLTEFAAGATTSLPVICLGVFAFLAPFMAARWGLERTMLAAIVPILLGVLLRSIGGVSWFFVGAVLVGVGIAIGNVVVPALIRARYAGSLALLLGVYIGMLHVSGAVGSALTAPLAVDAGWGWPAALAVWAAPCAVMLTWWLVLVYRQRGDVVRADPPTGMATVARRPLTWAITAFMALQSLSYYSLVTWLPGQLTDAGLTPGTAGFVLGWFGLLGLPGALLAPRFATGPRAVPFVMAVYAMHGSGLLLLGFGVTAAVTGALLCGVAQGAGFATGLTFIADQPTAGDVPALAACAQGVGYVVAAMGPAGLGLLYAATGSWWPPNLAMLAGVVALLLIALGVGPRLHRLHVAVRSS